jgi:hypothetical protein
MKRTIVVVTGLLILLALALLPSQPALLAARPAQKVTPTPAAEAEPTATPAAEEEVATDESEAELTMADLLLRLESLEATVAELHAAHEAAHALTFADVNSVNLAVYLLDAVGMHELETRLVSEGEILAGDSGQVGQIGRLLSTVAWPKELVAEAAALQETLGNLSIALADDDLATAQPLSTEAHVAYRAFSHNAQMWIAEATTEEMTDARGQANRVNTALYLLDGVDLHALSERLSEEKEIFPGDSGKVEQVARLLSTVDWPEELTEEAGVLQQTLSVLAAALADDDLKTATPLADDAHDAQHDFSHNAQAWLAAAAVEDSHEGVEHHDEAPAEHSHGG